MLLVIASVSVFAVLYLCLRLCQFDRLFSVCFTLILDAWMAAISDRPKPVTDYPWQFTPGSGFVSVFKYGTRKATPKAEDRVDPETHPDLRPLTEDEFQKLKNNLQNNHDSGVSGTRRVI